MGIEMFERRTIKPFGTNGAHLTMPVSLIGQDAYVFTESDRNRLEEMVYEVLMLRKIKKIDDSDAMKAVKDLEARVVALEARISQQASQ
jgi:putative transposon-encoded protein